MSRFKLFDWWKSSAEEPQTSAQIAKARLQVLIGTDRQMRSHLTKKRVDEMHNEIVQVISKYIAGVELSDVQINHREENDIDVLEMSVTLPEGSVIK